MQQQHVGFRLVSSLFTRLVCVCVRVYQAVYLVTEQPCLQPPLLGGLCCCQWCCRAVGNERQLAGQHSSGGLRADAVLSIHAGLSAQLGRNGGVFVGVAQVAMLCGFVAAFARAGLNSSLWSRGWMAAGIPVVVVLTCGVLNAGCPLAVRMCVLCCVLYVVALLFAL